MSKNICILICDDNESVHDTVGAYIKQENMEYISAFDGEEALRKFKESQPDFIILDIMMPGIFGTEVCKEIRKSSNVPILLLTAKGEEIDRILGLELGADDYVVKPFSPREIVARIKTILRRTSKGTSENKEENRIRFHELMINLDTYTIEIENQKIEATPKEIEILYLLASNVGKVFTREQILSSIWGYDFWGDTRVIDTHIKRLRKKLQDRVSTSEIKSVYGIGYKFEVHS